MECLSKVLPEGYQVDKNRFWLMARYGSEIWNVGAFVFWCLNIRDKSNNGNALCIHLPQEVRLSIANVYFGIMTEMRF